MLKMTGALIAMPKNRAAQTNSQYLISMCHNHRPTSTYVHAADIDHTQAMTAEYTFFNNDINGQSVMYAHRPKSALPTKNSSLH